MSGGDDLSTKFFTYKMTIDFDMLGAFKKKLDCRRCEEQLDYHSRAS